MRPIQTRFLAATFALLAVLAFSGSSALAADSTALGTDGSLYQLQVLDRGQLDAPVAGSVADDPVLVLEIRRAGEPVRQEVVPGTEGPGVESFAYLTYEEGSDTLFVTWEQRTNNIHSQILLNSFRGGEWSETIPISDLRFSLKSSPRLVVTRDRFRDLTTGDPEAESSHLQRVVLHVVWFEERGDGIFVVYSPVVLLDGKYLGSHPRLDLLNLLEGGESAGGGDRAPWTLPPTIRPSRDNDAVVIGVVDPNTSEVTTFQVAVLSGELTVLADDVASYLLEIAPGHTTRTPEGLDRLGGEMRAHIIDVGARMDRPLVRLVGDDMRAHIIDVGARYDVNDPQDLRNLAGEMRAHIIDVGFRLDRRGLSPQRETRMATLDLGAEPAGATAPGPRAVARVEEVLGRTALPELEHQPMLLLSGSGERVVVAWIEEDGNLAFQESAQDGGWEAPRTVSLSDELSLEGALGIVRDYVDNR